MGLLLFGNDGEEENFLRAVVDEAMGMTLRAVVALAFSELQHFAVHEHVGVALDEEDDFAACLVGVQTNAGTGLQTRAHDAVLAVEEHAGFHTAFAILEVGQALLFYLFEIDNHNSIYNFVIYNVRFKVFALQR